MASLKFLESREDQPIGAASGYPMEPRDIVFAIIVSLGIISSYLPQYRRIIIRSSAVGISPYTILLNVLFGNTTFAYSFIYLFGRAYDNWSAATSLAILLIGTHWVCSWILLGLYASYNYHLIQPDGQLNREFIEACWIAIICCIYAVLILLPTLPTAAKLPSNWKVYNPSIVASSYPGLGFLGLLAIVQYFAGLTFLIVLALVQYFPQIHLILLTKSVGSLSVASISSQTLVYFIMAKVLFDFKAFLMALVYLLEGLSCCVLSGVCLYHTNALPRAMGGGAQHILGRNEESITGADREHGARADDTYASRSDADEQTSLLQE